MIQAPTFRRSIVSRFISIGWAPVVVLALHSGLTAALGHQSQYDPVFHFLGGAAGAYSLWRALGLFRQSLGPLAGMNPSVAVIAAMVAVTIAWELLEFASDRLLGTHVQLGTGDTSSDILLGILGAVAVIAAAERLGTKAESKQ